LVSCGIMLGLLVPAERAATSSVIRPWCRSAGGARPHQPCRSRGDPAIAFGSGVPFAVG
jgi:hypothetical protein